MSFCYLILQSPTPDVCTDKLYWTCSVLKKLDPAKDPWHPEVWPCSAQKKTHNANGLLSCVINHLKAKSNTADGIRWLYPAPSLLEATWTMSPFKKDKMVLSLLKLNCLGFFHWVPGTSVFDDHQTSGTSVFDNHQILFQEITNHYCYHTMTHLCHLYEAATPILLNIQIESFGLDVQCACGQLLFSWPWHIQLCNNNKQISIDIKKRLMKQIQLVWILKWNKMQECGNALAHMLMVGRNIAAIKLSLLFNDNLVNYWNNS